MATGGRAQDKRPSAAGVQPSELVGVWEIEPYYLATRRECGRVKYTGTLNIRRCPWPDHCIGKHRFRWDMSEARGRCDYTSARSGIVDIDVYIKGRQITIKYSRTGRARYVDDQLTLTGDAMVGRSAVGHRIVYRRRR